MKKKRIKTGRPLTPYGFNLLAKRGDESLTDKRDLIFLSNYREGAIQDQGATEATLSANRLILTDRTVSVLGAIRMIERDVAKYGVFLKDGSFHPLLEEIYPRYINLLRTLLRDLGLEKKEGGGFDIVEYARERYGPLTGESETQGEAEVKDGQEE